MQKIRFTRIIGLISICLIVVILYSRQFILFQLESNKVSILLEAVKTQSFSQVDQSFRRIGRQISEQESNTLLFDKTTMDGEKATYRLHGGIMARIIHDGEEILEIDLQKLEFK